MGTETEKVNNTPLHEGLLELMKIIVKARNLAELLSRDEELADIKHELCGSDEDNIWKAMNHFLFELSEMIRIVVLERIDKYDAQ